MDVHHSLKKANGPLTLRIKHIDVDLFPFDVHPAVEEEAVETFEFRELRFWEVLCYEVPYVRGQLTESWPSWQL
jgi:hypothetical protein